MNTGIFYTLVSRGYQMMNSNVPFIRFFSKLEKDGNVKIIGCIDSNGRSGLGSEQLDSITFQVERKFLLSGQKNIDIFYLIFSGDIARDKELCQGNSKFWLIDLQTQALIVFENQPEDFDGLRSIIEKIIVQSTIAEKEKKEINLWKRIPWVTIVLFVINIGYFIYLELHGSTDNPMYMLKMGASYYDNVLNKHEYYRLLTCMFMHYGIAHLIDNMFGLILLGNEAEQFYGRVKYIIIYFVSGIAGSLGSAIYFSHTEQFAICAGASGAIYGIMGALIVKIIEEKRKSRNAVGKMILVLLLLYSAGSGTDQVDNVAHIVGLATGFVVGTISYFFIGGRKRYEH